jgi:hypothetical protein
LDFLRSIQNLKKNLSHLKAERSKPGFDLSPKSDYQNVFLVMIPK